LPKRCIEALEQWPDGAGLCGQRLVARPARGWRQWMRESALTLWQKFSQIYKVLGEAGEDGEMIVASLA
jgi:hypothetical protein